MHLKRFLLTFASILVFFILFPKNTYAWKFVVAGDTRSNHTTHAKVLAALKTKVPNNIRITYLNVGDVTAQATTSDWATWRKIVTGSDSYASIFQNQGGILPTNWWTNYSTSPPEYFSPAAFHDRKTTGWEQRWVENLPAQVGLSAYSGIAAHSGGRYGSVKYDNVIWIWLDDYSTLPAGQDNFLKQTLIRAAQDPQVTWKFVIFHRPMVSCGGNHGDWPVAKTWNDNLFVPYDVDFTLSGHNHYYTRSCPFISGSSKRCDSNFQGGSTPLTQINGDPKGPIHIVSGGGGAEIYPAACTSSCSQCPWLEKGASSHHFLEFNVNGGVIEMKMWEVDASKSYPYLKSSTPYDTLTFRKSSATPTPGGPTSTPTPPPPPTPGDGNNDGKVDGKDFIIWLKHFGQNVSGPSNGDYDKNGQVRISDYIVWVKNYTG